MSKRAKKPETEKEPRTWGDRGVTLSELADDWGLSEKAIYQAQRRNRERIGRGSKEDPFPEPIGRYRGTYEYDAEQIEAWYQDHTASNNPSRRRRAS